MNEDLAAFLARHEPVAEAWPVWGDGRLPLHERTYLSRYLPPDRYVSSVRAVLFHRDEVMLITGPNQEPYVVPGGRREPDESVAVTLQRELLEETGWRLGRTAVLGFTHFRHLSPKPADYPYPYPDFVQVVFTAMAATFHPEAIQDDPYVARASFQPTAVALTLPMAAGQRELLRAAMQQRQEWLAA